MSGKSDQIKGHAEEVAGIVTGDKDLEAQGTADRRAGEAQHQIDDAKEKVAGAVEKVKGKVDETLDKAKDALH